MSEFNLLSYLSNILLVQLYCFFTLKHKANTIISTIVCIFCYVGTWGLLQNGNWIGSIILLWLVNYLTVFFWSNDRVVKILLEATTALLIVLICDMLVAEILETICSGKQFLQAGMVDVTSRLLAFSILLFLAKMFSENVFIITNYIINILVVLLFPVIDAWILFLGLRLDVHLEEVQDQNLLSIMIMVNILLTVICLGSYKRYQEYSNFSMQLEETKKAALFYQCQAKREETMHILVHDIRKHLQTIEKLNEENERDELAKYITDLDVTTSYKVAITYCNYPVLNAMINYYQMMAKEAGITLEVDIRKNTMEQLTDMDITSIFGNLLDNAIYAGAECDSPWITLKVYRKEESNQSIIMMTNSCEKDSSRQYRQGHGYGMLSVKNIIKKYNGQLEYYYNSDTHTYHTIIWLHS